MRTLTTTPAPLLCLVLGLSMMLLPLPQSALAQKAPQLEIGAEVGFGEVAKLDSMTPLWVRLTNRGEAPFQGVAEVAVKTDPQSVTRYRVAVELAPGTSKEYELSFLNLPRMGKRFFLVVKNRQGREVVKLPLSIKESAPAQSFLLVSLNPQPGALGFMSDFRFARRTVDPYSPEDPDLSFSQYTNSQVAVGDLPLTRIPENGAALSGVDMLVVLEGDFNRLSDAQVQALEGFVARGGILLVATGPNGSRIAASPLARLLPRQLTGTTQAEGLISPLASWAGLPSPWPGDQVGSLISRGKLRPGARVLAGLDTGGRGIPMLVERRLGSGAVLELNLDLVGEPFQSWAGKKEFLGYLIARYGSNPTLFAALSHPSTLISAMGSLILRLPALRTTIFFFVLLYLILVGPANFLILSYLRLHQLLWLTLTSLVALFTLAGFVLGFRIQGNHNRILQIDQVVVGPEGGAAYRTATGIFNSSPTRLVTSLTTPGVAYPKVPPGGDQGIIGLRFSLNDRASAEVELSGQTVRLIRKRPRWSYDFDYLEGLIPDDDRFSGIRVSGFSFSPGGNLTGEVVNQSNLTLYDATLVTPLGSYRLGRLKGGESKAIDNYQIQYELPIKLGSERLSAGYIKLFSDLTGRLSKLATSQRLFLVAGLPENLVEIRQSTDFRKQGYSLVVIELSGNRLAYGGPTPPGIRQLFLLSLSSSGLVGGPLVGGGPMATENLNRLVLSEGDEAVWVVELSPERAEEALAALNFSFSTDLSPMFTPLPPMQRKLAQGSGRRQEAIVEILLYNWKSRSYQPHLQVRQWGSALVSFFPDWALSPTGQVRIKLRAEEDLVIYDVEARLSPARLSHLSPTGGSAGRPPAGGAG